MTDNQKKILEFARQNDQITKQTAVKLIGGQYYCNAEKYVGDVLSRMVKAGLLKRLKPGVFALGNRANNKSIPSNQLEIF